MKNALEELGPFNGDSGELYGYLFENSQTGLKRELFWNIIHQVQTDRLPR